MVPLSKWYGVHSNRSRWLISNSVIKFHNNLIIVDILSISVTVTKWYNTWISNLYDTILQTIEQYLD